MEKKLKKLRWNLKATFLSSLLILIFSLLLILMLGDKPIWLELELVVLIFGLFLFMCYSLALYRGIIFRNLKMPNYAQEHISFTKLDTWVNSGIPIVNTNFFTEMGLEVGIFAAILGFIIDCVVTLFLTLVITLLIWLGLNIFISSILMLFFPLYYLFKRSVLILLRHSQACYGRLFLSVTYGFAYALLYSLMICGIIYLVHCL